jgi:hypothetical protein
MPRIILVPNRTVNKFARHLGAVNRRFERVAGIFRQRIRRTSILLGMPPLAAESEHSQKSGGNDARMTARVKA